MSGNQRKFHIGVSVFFQNSFFSNGMPTTALVIAELFGALGHQVTLINHGKNKTWWDDCTTLQSKFQVHPIDDPLSQKMDLFLDIEGYIEPEKRKALADHVIVFLRKPYAVREIELSVYPIVQPKRNMSGVDMIWTWDTATPQEHHLLELIYQKPVYAVPFLWTPIGVEAHRQQMNFPEWLHIADHFQVDAETPWECHVAEGNMSVMSNCTLPVVILANSLRKKVMPCKRYILHNADHLKENKFFKENVLAHCAVEDVTVDYAGRQRCTDWRVHKKSFVLAHSRFQGVRPYLLDLAWNGIPFVHNCKSLADMGCGLDRYYYKDNSITEATEALRRLNDDFVAKNGCFTFDNVSAVRKAILTSFGIIEEKAVKWVGGLMYIMNKPAAPLQENTSLSSTVPLKFTLPDYMATDYGKLEKMIAEGDSQEKQAEKQAQKPAEKPVEMSTLHEPVKSSPYSPNTITVCFTDMWADFRPEYNFFTLLLDTALRHHRGAEYTVEGISYQTYKERGIVPDLVIFGPFGSDWKSIPTSIPKAHFTGENTGPIKAEGVFLNMGFRQVLGTDEGYLRLPLWMLEVDWFGADVERIANPKPLPMDAVTKGYTDLIPRKEKFCSFIVTNGMNPVRNNAFHWLNAYKKVDSAGRLFNNIGDAIFAGLGGGGGELKKHEFLKDYKFSIAYENASSEGYTTEKILHAKAAGCIPIYWGDPLVNRDFDSNGFICAQKVTTPEELVALVKKVEDDDELYKKMMAIPALDSYRVDLVRRRLSRLAELLYKGMNRNELLEGLPRFLGAKDQEEAEKISKDRTQGIYRTASKSSEQTENTTMTPPKPTISLPPTLQPYKNMVIATTVTQKFLGSVSPWIQSVSPLHDYLTDLSIVIYLGRDVPSETAKELAKQYPFVFWKTGWESAMEADVGSDFADIADYSHYAWKLWNYKDLITDTLYRDRVVWYYDIGAMFVRLPFPFLEKAQKEGICVVEDTTQDNAHWCHADFCEALVVTAEEKAAAQILGGVLCFVGGNAKAVDYFTEAWSYGRQRKVIVGKKWEGIGADGKPYGHRHDQSILSILASRKKIAKVALEIVYNDKSLYDTENGGSALYFHRGGEIVKVRKFAPAMDQAYIINLDRREDRMTRFYENHDIWAKNVQRVSAVEGRNLELTPALARLFQNNDFLWKKAIMGCALSHMGIWKKLTEDKYCDSYLVLEDDVKFQKDWIGVWSQACHQIPPDWDILYLGGVLPPNKGVYDHVIQKVNPFWGFVKPNQIFGQKIPTPYFHFCNYSYVIRKSAAQKILGRITARDGYFTSADHMICNQIDMLKMYMLQPLVTGCYQDDDPKYKDSQFNNYQRIDGFDSDLWNNDERFQESEIQACKGLWNGQGVGIVESLHDVKTQKAAKHIESVKLQKIVAERPFLVLDKPDTKTSQFLEQRWLNDLFRKNGYAFNITNASSSDPVRQDCPIFCVGRGEAKTYMNVMKQYEEAGADYCAIHFSDEYCNEPIEWYGWSHCRGVVRFYWRDDIPADIKEKVITIPLGYNKHVDSVIDGPWVETPGLPFREQVWCFFGTAWKDRDKKLEPLKQVGPYTCKTFSQWMDPGQLSSNEYCGAILNSMFVPCPAGQNIETYRIYEAIQHGAFPLIVDEEGYDTLIKLYEERLHFLTVKNWGHAAAVMNHLIKPENKHILEQLRTKLFAEWFDYKDYLRNRVCTILGLTGTSKNTKEGSAHEGLVP